MKKIIIVLAMVLTAAICFAQFEGSAPEVTDVVMVQEGGIVRVTYNLSYEDADPPYSHITLVISNDEGETFKISPKPEFLEGDIGMGVSHGDNKEIIWRIRAQYDAHGNQGLVGENFRARVIAKRDDNYNPADPESSAPAGMIFVQGTAGVTFEPGGQGYFTPAEDYHVSLSSFYISRFEVTQSEWTSVMDGIYNPNWWELYGLGPNHPAYNISWFDAIEYCNRRSMMEGLTPCYSYTAGETEYGTNPDNWPAGWKTNRDDHTNVSCNWEANGYRLPTEMEREFAARGGVPAANANTFNHTYAGTDEEADLGDYAWYNANSSGRTHAVGTKLPNELGLYDMSGNVLNHVWDIRGSYPTGAYNNPTGRTTGDHRVFRGGSRTFDASLCRVFNRNYNFPTYRLDSLGFRVARNVP